MGLTSLTYYEKKHTTSKDDGNCSSDDPDHISDVSGDKTAIGDANFQPCGSNTLDDSISPTNKAAQKFLNDDQSSAVQSKSKKNKKSSRRPKLPGTGFVRSTFAHTKAAVAKKLF
jgi:hypothetical protein